MSNRLKIMIALLGLTWACRDRESKSVNSTPASTSIATERASPGTIADSTPAGVIRRYYAAIQSGRYDDAYALWSDSGRASGKTAQEFAAGFSQTVSVNVAVSDSVSIEGAAGSQYATVPVVVEAALRNGERQHFVGTYVLRRAMVDGATPEQRQWRIYSAHLQQQ